jgi:hypothetical protein
MCLNAFPFKLVTLNSDETGDFVIAWTFPVAFIGDTVVGFLIPGIQNRL